MKRAFEVFEDTNFIATKEIETIEEAALLVAAGVDMADRHGNDWFYCSVKTEAPDNEEDDDALNYREPTDKEILKRIQDELNDEDGRVYAGIHFTSDSYTIERQHTTTLHSDFFVGQTVYIMYRNKIKELKVANIMLSTRKMKLAYDCMYTVTPKDESHIAMRFNAASQEPSPMIFLAQPAYDYGRWYDFGVMPASEVFATKEELVKHLMEQEQD